REEDKLISLDGHGERLGCLNRGPPTQSCGQPNQTCATDRINLIIAGPDKGQPQLGGRLQHEGIVGARRTIGAEGGDQKERSEPCRTSSQKSPQPISDDQVDESEKQCCRQQRWSQIDLAAARQGLAPS